MFVPKTDREKVRASFSLSQGLKNLIRGKEAREDLTWDLAPLYVEVMDNHSIENPREIYCEEIGNTIQLFPCPCATKKIRVKVKGQ